VIVLIQPSIGVAQQCFMFQLQVAVTSEPGEGLIIAFRDYDKKFSPHVVSCNTKQLVVTIL
jgi:hypothetical protein